MGKGLSKLVVPALAIGGAALLGSTLFPETTASLTGGLLGSSGTSGIGPVASGTDYGNMLAGTSAGSSIFSNPTVLSSGILAGTSLLSGLFGGSADEAALKQQQELAQKQFDAEMAYKQAALAQALEIAKINAAASGRGGGGGGGNGAAVAAQLKIAKMNAIANNAAQKGEAMQLPLKYDNRAAAAQNTGVQSGSFFNSLSQMLQAPALRSA